MTDVEEQIKVLKLVILLIIFITAAPLSAVRKNWSAEQVSVNDTSYVVYKTLKGNEFLRLPAKSRGVESMTLDELKSNDPEKYTQVIRSWDRRYENSVEIRWHRERAKEFGDAFLFYVCTSYFQGTPEGDPLYRDCEGKVFDADGNFVQSIQTSQDSTIYVSNSGKIAVIEGGKVGPQGFDPKRPFQYSVFKAGLDHTLYVTNNCPQIDINDDDRYILFHRGARNFEIYDIVTGSNVVLGTAKAPSSQDFSFQDHFWVKNGNRVMVNLYDGGGKGIETELEFKTDGAPKAIKEGVSKDESAVIKKKLEEAGATVTIK
jgi:hypothetical protein